MTSLPAGDSGAAVERLQDEQWHIQELLDTYARYQRDPDRHAAEAGRLVALIYTLLRVHCQLESMLEQPALALGDAGFQSALLQAGHRRKLMLDALERAEALSPRDPAHPQEMAALAHSVRNGFRANEQQLFMLARRSPLDLAALDSEMAAHQEALLSAGKNAVHDRPAPPDGPDSS